MNLGFIGCGKMGKALAKSFAEKGFNLKKITCFDLDKGNLAGMKKLGFKGAKTAEQAVKGSAIIFICVKPQDIETALAGIKPLLRKKIVVSIAAGKKISSIAKASGAKKIVRVIPNIAALASESMSVYACKGLNAGEKKRVKSLLSLSGKALEMDEKFFDSVTALSGSGPAFAAHFIETLALAGVKNGLGKNDALLLAEQTVYGTSKLLLQGKFSAKEVVEMVSSPNGTTVAGMKALKQSGFEKAVLGAVSAARTRSEELGKA